MPRSSKSKSHKPSKHSKEAREYSDSEEDVKMKESSSRVSKDLASGEKRKLSSQSREGRESKDLSGYGNGNGDAPEEYLSTKRRKEKGEGSGGGDRWNGGVDESGDGRHEAEKESKSGSSKTDQEKGLRQKEAKGYGDSKSKSSKRHESGGGSERKEEIVLSGVEKEEAKSGKGESKKKSETDSVRKEGKDLKEKEHGSERERKQDSKRETEVKGYSGDTEKKIWSQSGDVGEEKQSKRSRENTDRSIRSEVRNSDLDRDAEKKMRKRRDGSGDRDKYEDDILESDEKRLPSRGGDRSKDERYRDAKHKDGGYGDKYREDGDRDERHREEKYEAEKDRRRREDKYRGDGYSRDNRRRDDKYSEDGDRDNRYREDKYYQHEDRDNRHKEYREEVERDSRHRDDKYREDSERDDWLRDDKYLEDGDKDVKRREDRYREEGEKDDRQRDNKYREDGERDNRRKEEKHRDDFERDGRHRDGKHGEESDREKRPRDTKYTDDHNQRDRSGDRSDSKRLKDESHAADIHSRKGGIRENSPNYDDRASRYKDDQGRRRADDKEDRSDIRFQSSKDQYDAEKRSGTVPRVDSIADRGKSSSRNTDLERTSNHNRRRSSPSTGPYTTKDHFRQSKQEDSKYRDHDYDERGRRNRDYSGSVGAMDKIPSTRSAEKVAQKDDSYVGDGSAEWRLKSDSRTSSLQVLDKSPSSTSKDRRHLSRSEVKRSLDAEDLALRSGSKDFSGKEGRGNRDLPIETLAGDELSHADGDTLSVSSPFARGSHLSGSTRSLLPPPLPFRPGVDSPSVLGSSEDDCRGKPGNRHRRGSESNVGRFQGNSWRGVPNWPSPVANGFIFQHGPAHVSFPPVMQQFPAPPMFGVRPSMELNHPGLPYHIPDADRFPSHGRPIGWRNPMDSSCAPFHSWDSNSAVLGDEANLYGRPEWDQYRNMPMNRSWDTSDMWKGPNRSASVELPSASHKEAHSAQGPGDESLTGQSAQQAQSEQRHADLEAESKAISQSSDAVEKNTPEDLKIIPEEPCSDSKLSKKEDTCLYRVYLSKLDISADLTEPDLYEQCTSLLLSDQNMVADIDNSKILYLEQPVEGKAPSKFSSTSLFAAANESVFQKAISLYKQEREDVKVINGEKGSVANKQNESFVAPEEGKVFSEDCVVEKVASVGGLDAKEMHPSSHDGMLLPDSPQKVEGSPILTDHQIDDPMVEEDIVEKPEQPIPAMERVSMEMDVISNLAEENAVEELNKSPAKVEGSYEAVPDDLTTTSNALDENHSPDGNGEMKLVDAKCGPLLSPDVSSEAFEVVVPIESGSVILSRIHHSPESTH
nr:titin homolog isoform X1 [Ipomoea batatas]